jgi:histidinol-phosphatase (PHP family)
MLPPDNHVHSEYSWDALAGSMERTCEQAVAVGLPALAFTEHADFAVWTLTPEDVIPEQWRTYVSEDLMLTPPAIDLESYLRTLDRCRERFPSLRILSGVELSEPHWFRDEAAELVARGGFERVLASMHTADSDRTAKYVDVSLGFQLDDPAEVIRGYLAEAYRLVTEFDGFEVLTHIDYPVRYWPADGKPFDAADFEDEYREVLRALARAEKVLEVNTRVPLDPRIIGWWRADGGQAITFASDAHEPSAVARGFREAVRVARAAGFKASDDPFGFWVRE